MREVYLVTFHKIKKKKVFIDNLRLLNRDGP